MMEFNDFRVLVLKALTDYSKANGFTLKVNNGVSELKAFEIIESETLNIENQIYWLCKNDYQRMFLRFSVQQDNIYSLIIDNKQISIMLDGDFRRLTQYPSDDFNKSVDNILKNETPLYSIIDFMVNEEIMLKEVIGTIIK